MSNEAKYLKAKKLVTGGMQVREASKAVGIKESLFYYHQAKNNRGPKVSRVVEIPQDKPQQLMMLVGSPQQIAEAMRGIL